jgi:predicted Zn finger-like uncharacterized protein
MQIVCPHCSTSYAINLASLGTAGRTVRCSRCKEVWLARPEDAIEVATQAPEMAAASRETAEQQAAAGGEPVGPGDHGGAGEPPHVDSPSIAGDWPNSPQGSPASSDANWTSAAGNDPHDTPVKRQQSPSWLRRMLGSKAASRPQSRPRSMPQSRPQSRPGVGQRRQSSVGLSATCVAMGALALALLTWRVDMVRLLPQTAAFYKLVGLDVNLRGLRFRDVKVTSETVEGKPVLIIEGVITGESSKPMELPRLRFSVRDAQGAEIYAWNAVLEQAVLRPGERTPFKSRLASPPPEGRNIDVRFFNKRDLAGGAV